MQQIQTPIISKSIPPYSVADLFQLPGQGTKISKMAKSYSVNCPRTASKELFWINPLIFYSHLRALSHSRNVVEFSNWKNFKFSNFHIENLQINRVQITEKCICKSKHIYSCHQAELCARFLSLLSRQSGITHFSPGSIFRKSISPSCKNGGGGNYAHIVTGYAHLHAF